MYFLHIYEYKTLKPIESILKRRKRKREKNGGTEPNLGGYILYRH
jgi:hypothetical protein